MVRTLLSDRRPIAWAEDDVVAAAAFQNTYYAAHAHRVRLCLVPGGFLRPLHPE